MDPVTAIGVVSAALSLVTFSTSLVKGAIQIHDAIQSDEAGSRSRESVITEMQRFASSLSPQAAPGAGLDDNGLLLLANQCRELSEKLLALLTKLKPKNPASKSQTLRAAIRSKLHENSINELEESLDACRSQLHLELTYNMGRRTQQLLDSLANASNQDAAKFHRLQTSLDELRQGVHVSSIDQETKSSFRRLIGLHEDALCIGACRRILRSLSFEDMRRRYEAVDDPHADTFRWIVETRTPNNGLVSDDNDLLSMQALAKEKYSRWLRSPDGILHVSGKLGSGKSTLMKLLSQCSETMEGLQEWAGDRTLVFAAFFFWKPGSALQTSIPGLIRSLLYDVLSACQNLIPHVLPESWKRANEIPWHDLSGVEIAEGEIRVAFQRLVQLNTLTHCFCFFIDGLDEFTETPRQDRRHLVDMLKSWYKGSPGVIKLCVSSREDNVFMNAFPADTRLRIHHLTKFDMQDYVKDQLKHIEDEKIKNFLIREIPVESQGIFLWVTLVVKLVREKVEDDTNFVSLQRYLKMLPKEMNNLLDHILSSMHEEDRKRAYQVSSMMELSKPYRSWPTSTDRDCNLLCLAAIPLLEKYDSDGEFALREDLENEFGDTTLEEQTTRALKRLNGWCRGLIETNASGSGGIESRQLIDYTHRSVCEFLELPHIRRDMELLLHDFDAVGALTQLAVAALRLSARYEVMPESEIWSALIDINMAKEQDNLWHLLEYGYLHGAFEPIYHSDPSHGIYRFFLYPSYRRRSFGQRISPAGLHGADRGRPPFIELRDIVSFASYHGHYQCIVRELDRHLVSFTNHQESVVLMAYATLASVKPDYRILELLFERQILTVDMTTRLMPLSGRFLPGYWKHVPRNSNMNREFTLWEMYLTGELLCWLEGVRHSDEARGARFSHVAEMFLGRGADARFSASINWGRQDEETGDLQVEEAEDLQNDATDGSDSVGTDYDPWGDNWTLYGSFEVGANRETFALKFIPDFASWSEWNGLPVGQTFTISLRDWIEQSELVNKDRLLQLIDGGTKEVEDDSKPDGVDGEVKAKGTADDSTLPRRPSHVQDLDVAGVLRAKHGIHHVQIVATLLTGFLFGAMVSKFWARH